MNAYGPLAGAYDALTADVDYARRADYLEKLFRRARIPVRVVLDLACGTGELTALLTERGYELVAADASPDMLARAREKAAGLAGEPPVFLHQSMTGLDLYGTVDAAVCCLDSINYLTSPRDVREAFRRLHLFLSPGGVLVFDVSTLEKFAALDGQVFLDETEDVYCVWRAEYGKRSRLCSYWLDLFTRDPDGKWSRFGEEHRQRGYAVDELKAWLLEAGFTRVRTYGDCRMSAPREKEQRVYFSAIRGG